LAANQRGSSVRGSVEIAAAGAGGRLQVDLFASARALGGTGPAKQVRVGSARREALSAGTARLSLSLNRRARQALARRGHLALTVKLVMTAPDGAVSTLMRGVTLRVSGR
jgi:hypothetical protein